VIPITLNGNSISADSGSVTIAGSTATITAAGTYSISGSLSDGQIIVNSTDEKVVRLIFNGVDIHSSTSAPIYVTAAEEVILILADNTENTVSDGSSYVFAVPEDEEPNATIFSKADLSIYGNGSLTVNANFRDGINSKDGIVITSGNITITAADDGIRGKDYLVVKDGSITINAQGDGMKSDNEEDATRGYISIENGVFNITAGGDAINAQTDAIIENGTFTLTTGGGSGSRVNNDTSAKGIKGLVNVNIDGGTFTINAADDGVHSNNSITVNGGAFTINTGDDGMHADSTLTINGGDIQISESYEGIESALITINAGNIHVNSSDDGINVAGGNDSSGMGGPGGRGGGRPGRGGPGQDAFNYAGSYYLYIHGGYIVVNAYGDGLDVNGAIEMTDGIVLVSGPTAQMNGAIDYDASFNLTGGFIAAAGSSGMAMAPGQNSGQSSILAYFNSTQPAGSLVHIQNSAGEDILTFAPAKEYQSIAFSSPALTNGATYTIYTGGSSTGEAVDGLIQNGTYTPGTQYMEFTVSGTVTTVGSGGNRFRP